MLAVTALALVVGYLLGTGSEMDAEAQAASSADPRLTYYPNTGELGPNEMRIISLGTGMPNQRKAQASACWLVELGNGEKFLFDLGPGELLARVEEPEVRLLQ